MSGEVSSEINQRMLGGLEADFRVRGRLVRRCWRGAALVVVVVVPVVQPASSAAVAQPAVFRKSRRFIHETL